MKIGILGGGQLGLMLAEAARSLSIECVVLDPKPDAVAARAARHLVADWTDGDALRELAQLDAVTYEFENVPAAAVETLAEHVPVHPAPAALVYSGDRVLEKNLFRELGIETAPFEAVDDRADLERAVERIGLPAILKTRRFGYDGKGQAVLREPADVAAAWTRLGGQPLVLEGFVPFDREVSVIAVRGRDGAMRTWPATENQHVDGILHVSRAPAPDVDVALFASAVKGLEALMARLEYVGVLVVEFFQLGDRLVANEMACRVHNSGHWTIEGAATSQFENHMRAVAGRPLGDTAAARPAAMLNLIAEEPSQADCAWLRGLAGVELHLYGKRAAPGRKIGHLTIVDETRAAVEERLAEILARLGDRAANASL